MKARTESQTVWGVGGETEGIEIEYVREREGVSDQSISFPAV